MSSPSENNDKSLVIGINLVPNPRNYLKDALLRCSSGYDTTKAILFATSTRFVDNFTKIYSLIRNKNKETENQFPYGMCYGYLSDTFIDYAQLEQNCIAYIKQEKENVLKFYTDLDIFLGKAYQDRKAEDLQNELNTINKMPEDVPPITTKADALTKFNTKVSDENKAYVIEDIEKLEEQFYLEIDIKTISTEISAISNNPTLPHNLDLQNQLQEKENTLNDYQDTLDTLNQSNTEDSILKLLYLKQLEEVVTNENEHKTTLTQLITERNKKYSILKEDEYLSEKEYVVNLKVVTDACLQFENKLKELESKYQDMFSLLKQYRIANVAVLDLKKIDSEGKPVTVNDKEQGTIPENLEFITNQKDFNKNTWLEIALIDYSETDDFFGYNYKSRKFGNSLYWANLMPQHFCKRDVTLAGMSYNQKDVDLVKIFFAKRKDYTEDNPEVFTEEVYKPIDPKYLVIVYIEKNTIPTQYGVIYLTEDDCPYLQGLIDEKDKPLLSNPDDSESYLEFYPTIPIKQNMKDLAEVEPKALSSVLAKSSDEILRNVFINMFGLTEVFSTKRELTFYIEDFQILKSVKARYDTYKSPVMNSFKQNDSTPELFSYYDALTNKNILNTTYTYTLDKIIKDVYLFFGLAVDDSSEEVSKYFFELFNYLEPLCNVDKQKFLDYQDHQTNNNYKYLDAYNLENIVSIRNTQHETNLRFNYIEKEELSGEIPYDSNIVHNPDTSMYNLSYPVYDTPSQTLHGINSDYYIINGEIDYTNAILEVYQQTTLNTYTKISIHGLKIEYNKNYLLPFLQSSNVQIDEGTYETKDDTKEYRTDSDSLAYSLNQGAFVKDTSVAEVSFNDTLIEPKELVDLKQFIIPLWHHDLTDMKYYEKDTKYTVNDINNLVQRSLNLLVSIELTDEQQEIITTPKNYFVPFSKRKEVMLACLDSFLSKYTREELAQRIANNVPDTEADKEKQDFSDMMYKIAVAPNISAYRPVSPTWDKATYMVGQEQLSKTFVNQIMNSKLVFEWEKYSLENNIFGDLSTQFTFENEVDPFADLSSQFNDLEM
jgi:hypothetical protein